MHGSIHSYQVLDRLQRSETWNVCNLEEEEWWGVKIRNKIMKHGGGNWLVGWLQRSENRECMYGGGGRMVGCTGLKQSYACNVEEEVGETQTVEISTARKSDCVDC